MTISNQATANNTVGRYKRARAHQNKKNQRNRNTVWLVDNQKESILRVHIQYLSVIHDFIRNENQRSNEVSNVLKFFKPLGVLPKDCKYAAFVGVIVRVNLELFD